MRWHDIAESAVIKPLNPEQAMKRASKQRKARAKLASTKATAQIKISDAQKAAAEI